MPQPPDPDLATDELLVQARGGDDLAYDRLFDRFGTRLLIFIRCRMGASLSSKVDPMDVLQETYLEAHRSFARFEPAGEEAFRKWLYGIADNRIKDLAKHHNAQKRQPPGGHLIRASSALGRIRAEQAGPSTIYSRRERDEKLVTAMDGLPPKERDALLLRFFQGLTLEAIAEQLGCSERTVRRLLGLAIQKVGKHLTAGPEGD